MEYHLSNGETVNLYSNNDVAKFVLLKLPTLGFTFVGAVPHLRQTEQVRKYAMVAQRLALRRTLARRAKLERMTQRPIDDMYDDHFDDDVPF